jgi:hypothetical protein
MVLIIESMQKNYYSVLLLFLRKLVFKLISIRSHQDAGIRGLTLWLRLEEQEREKRKGEGHSLQQGS